MVHKIQEMFSSYEKTPLTDTKLDQNWLNVCAAKAAFSSSLQNRTAYN